MPSPSAHHARRPVASGASRDDPGSLHPHGLFSRDDVRRLGFSDEALRWRRRTGAWIRLRHNTYVTAERLSAVQPDPVDAYALDAAAVLFGARDAGTVVSHRSAAILHRVPLVHRWPDRVAVTVARSRRGGLGNVEEHTTRSPLPPDQIDVGCGVRVTSPARTAIDVAAWSSRQEGIVILDAVLAQRLSTTRELLEIADSRSQARTPRALATLLDLADERSPDPVTSLARLALHEHGVPVDGVGVTLRRRAPDPPATIPLLWPHARIAAIHRADTAASALLLASGITPVVMDADMVLYRGAEFAAVISGLVRRERRVS